MSCLGRAAAGLLVVRQLAQEARGMSISNSAQQFAEQLSKMARVYRRYVEGIGLTRQVIEQLSTLGTANLALPLLDTTSLMSALDLSEHIYRLLEPVVQQQEMLSRQFLLDEVVRSLREVTGGYAAAIREAAAQIATINVAVRQSIDWGIFDRLRKVIEARTEAIEAFKAAGWPIAPSMSHQLIDRVVEFYREGRVRYASRTIIAFYHRNDFERLIQTVEGWGINPLFAPRMHILRDALHAHCQGLYTLSVPALLPQIEGILNDYVIANGLVAKLGKIREVYNSAVGDLNDYDLIRWTIVTTLLYQLQNNVYVYTDFEGEIRKSMNRRRVTRHTVLHGIALRYDRPVHSLRSFVLLDALSALQSL